MDLDGSLFSYSNNYNFVTDAFLIDDLSEFSNEDIGGSIPGSSDSASLFSDHYSSLNTILDSDGYSSILGANFDIHQFSSLQDEQIGLEWLSDFAKEECFGAPNSGSDCSTEALASRTTSEWEGEKQRQTSKQPQEELITLSATKQRASSSLNMVIPCRARTKRKRCQVWPKPRSTPSAQALEEEEEEEEEEEAEEAEDEDEDEDEEYDGKQNMGKEGKGKGKGRESQPRRCTHCQTQKTPQWRQGPLGPKSLCNACGVRYKAGGLFPEYRPAKSPTFVSYVHSNSNKKVREMRGACLANLPKPRSPSVPV